MAPRLRILASVSGSLSTLADALKHRAKRFPPLPTELWETIFDELSESELLRMATVCTTFNALCIRIIMRRRMPNANNPDDIVSSSPYLELGSPMLAVIHLSFRPSQTQELTCYFAPINIRRDLRLLGDFIGRCPALYALDIFFHEDLLRLQCAHPSPGPRFSREELSSVLCSTISTMAGRRAGPVIIFTADTYDDTLTYPANICSCWPTDITDWGLHMVRFDYPKAHKLRSRARRMFKLKEKAIPEYRVPRSSHIRMHTGEMREVHAPSVLFSVHLWSSPSNSLSKPFTILVFNNRLITDLNLTQFRGDQGYLPPDYLNLVIVRVALPCLRQVTLGIESIDPTALGIFLHQHPTIEELKHCGTSDELLPRPAVNPPLVHPGLTTFKILVARKGSAGRLIPALIHSPNLHTFDFFMKPVFLSPANLSGFASDLRNISLRNNDIRLCFDLHCGTFPASEFSDVAGTLQCIRWVDICSDLAESQSILPWLALLPAVAHVNFRIALNQLCLVEENAAYELAVFAVSARTALGPGPELIVRRRERGFL
ncbi:hypothetical protein C8R47DRAFT_1102250 [Mycena vitilis]|nr:hypothetical protein C8R47DRAFT_1102250 [Mycena vitilis]